MDCPIENIVTYMHNCWLAASYLKKQWESSVESIHAPAGCYWEGNTVYFNTNLDPSATINAKFGNRGGICGNEGKCS